MTDIINLLSPLVLKYYQTNRSWIYSGTFVYGHSRLPVLGGGIVVGVVSMACLICLGLSKDFIQNRAQASCKCPAIHFIISRYGS